VGLSLYGYYGFKFEPKELQPALELKSEIAQIRRVGAGETVGYGATFKAERPTKLAILPIGYADGYPRALSNKAEAIVGAKRAKVAGRISMNIMTVDVTGISCSVGDEVILIGGEGDDKVDAEDLARWGETIPHEILSRLSPNISREYHFK
jgi:alanine racemase